jgi:hypothetical protein
MDHQGFSALATLATDFNLMEQPVEILMSVLSTIHAAMADAETPTGATNAHVRVDTRWTLRATDASM